MLRINGKGQVGRFGRPWPVLLAAAAGCSVVSGDPGAKLDFAISDIDPALEGAYQLALTDMNSDGRTDIIVLSVRSDAAFWYEAPHWQRHTLAEGLQTAIVGAAPGGPGDPASVALLTGFHRDSFERNSGQIELVRHTGEESWDAEPFLTEPGAHRAIFADVDLDGDADFVLAPIAGGGAPLAWPGPTPLLVFRAPDFTREPIAELSGTVHGLSLADLDEDGRPDILTAGYGGLWRHELGEAGWQSELIASGREDADPLRRGAGDVRAGRLAGGTQFLAAIETVHGTDGAVYLRGPDEGSWHRVVLDEDFELAHAIAVADFDADGADEIAIGDSRGAGGVRLYDSTDEAGRVWERTILDEGRITPGACEAADLTGDGRIDLVCAGLMTGNVRLYENRGDGR